VTTVPARVVREALLALADEARSEGRRMAAHDMMWLAKSARDEDLEKLARMIR
jgi:hypothetical protein